MLLVLKILLDKIILRGLSIGSQLWELWEQTWGQMNKTLCTFTIVCTHKDSNMHTDSFSQTYKAACTPDSISWISVIVETGTQAQALFPLPQLSINEFRSAPTCHTNKQIHKLNHSYIDTVWRISTVCLNSAFAYTIKKGNYCPFYLCKWLLGQDKWKVYLLVQRASASKS